MNIRSPLPYQSSATSHRPISAQQSLCACGAVAETSVPRMTADGPRYTPVCRPCRTKHQLVHFKNKEDEG